MFHDTIYHNLHYGDLSKPQEEVYKASQMAELHESVKTWPKVFSDRIQYMNLLYMKLKRFFGTYFFLVEAGRNCPPRRLLVILLSKPNITASRYLSPILQ